MKLADELFFVPHADDYIVYAPLRKAVAQVNATAIDILKQFRSGLIERCLPHAAFFGQLADAGILVAKEEQRGSAKFFTANRPDIFDPGGITLLLTTACTMRCSYCYSEGGERARTMQWPMAQAAIDWIVDHTLQLDRESFFVNFHGGGEVTTATPLLRRAVEYARKQAAKHGLTVRIESGLNGVMSAATLDWILGNLDGATVSLDGLPEIQNLQRPMSDGSESFTRVASTLRSMDAAGFQYGIRATVTRAGLDRLPESIEFMAGNFNARTIQVEPFFPVGRALKSGLDDLDEKAFVSQFRKARLQAENHGKTLKYSGARIHNLTDCFCKACGQSFALTPDGFVTSCYEVTEAEDPRSTLFFFGEFNQALGQFSLNEKRLDELRRLTGTHKQFCRDCFCKWHCAGDCPAKLAVLGDARDPSKSKRCHINRELTKDLLIDYLKSQNEAGLLSV